MSQFYRSRNTRTTRRFMERLHAALLAGLLLAIPSRPLVMRAAEPSPRETFVDTAESSIAEPITIVVAGSALVAVSIFARRRRASGSPD